MTTHLPWNEKLYSTAWRDWKIHDNTEMLKNVFAPFPSRDYFSCPEDVSGDRPSDCRKCMSSSCMISRIICNEIFTTNIKQTILRLNITILLPFLWLQWKYVRLSDGSQSPIWPEVQRCLMVWWCDLRLDRPWQRPPLHPGLALHVVALEPQAVLVHVWAESSEGAERTQLTDVCLQPARPGCTPGTSRPLTDLTIHTLRVTSLLPPTHRPPPPPSPPTK